jgi:hypothetical protein
MQGRALGSEEGTVIGSGLCEYSVEKRFSDFFGYGTLFNLVNIYGKRKF